MRHRTPDPRPSSLRCVNAVGACAFITLALAAPAEVKAQSVAPVSEAPVDLGEVVVTAGRTPLTIARARATRTPGGASVIATADFEAEGAVILADALASAPGVVVQSFFGGDDQPRLQLRGSGLQQNPAERGVLFLQDGLPLNRADGSYVVGLIDPRQAAFIEVFRGYTANRLGATVLGGALNFVSPSGDTVQGARLRLEGGSFGYAYGSVDLGVEADDWAGFASVSHSQRDGYRDYNGSSRTSVVLSSDHDLAPGVTSRFLAGYVDSAFDVSGPLTAAMLADNPRQVSTGPVVVAGVARNPGPNVVRDQPRRETQLAWIGNRTTATRGAHAFDAAVSFVHADDSFAFPVSAGVRETDGGDLNLMGRYALLRDGGGLPRLEVTGHYATGSADRVYALNVAGERGAVFGQGDLEARVYGLNLTANLSLGDALTLAPSLSWARAERTWEDTYALATRPTVAFNPMNPAMRLPDGAVAATDTGYDRRYDEISPSLALSWRPDERTHVYAAVSHSFEPPSHDDLIATINGTPNSSAGRPAPGNPGLQAEVFRTPDLKAQTSDTVEIGVRGRRGRFQLDGLVYYARVSDELLNLRDATGVSLGAINADATRHLGAEIGVSADLTDRLAGWVSYTYQDFRFVDDPIRGDNHLAGAPPHVVNANLSLAVTPALTVAANAHWRPSRTPVDNMNTLYSDAFATLDLRVAYAFQGGVTAFVETRNVFDEVHAASTLVVDQARPDQAVYLPGEGRALTAGLRFGF